MVAKKLPSVASQIRAAGAPKGSALERMIRDNQDFDLLSASEMDDEYSPPLWLRVAYRKQHPEIEFPDRNPGAVYPEVLSQVYRRMMASPDEQWDRPGATTEAESESEE